MPFRLGPFELILLSLMCMIPCLLIAVFWLLWRRRGQAAEEEEWPFIKAPNFLSPAEYSFYRVLLTAVQGALVVCPKVNLGDIFHVKEGSSNFMGWRSKINQKHVDFLLCDARTMTPQLAIELDDRSHRKRQEEDAVTWSLFRLLELHFAGMPWLTGLLPAG